MIASTTLAGPGSEASIGDALRSCAGLVDQHLILAPAASLESLAAAVRAAGIGPERVCWRVYEWPESFGEARNAALAFAEQEGATWALTVDTDERLELEPDAVLDGTARPEFDVLSVPDADLGYIKPRLIRCGSGARWRGVVHERLEGARAPHAVISGAFRELPKDAAAQRRVFERGRAAFADATDPHDARHLAECLLGLGLTSEAAAVYRRVAAMPGASLHERSWCEYRLAEQEIAADELVAAERRAALALARDPSFIQEFGWLLGFIAGKRGDVKASALWASYALGAPADMTRGGQRSPTWRAGCEALLGLRDRPS